MRDAILGFFKQFEYEPVLMNGGGLKKYNKFLVAGMGGSHFAADFLLMADSGLDLTTYRDYNLPFLSEDSLRERLIVCSSYSGNTEEVISAFIEGKRRGFSMAALSTGGKLLDLAEEAGAPYIRMPSTGIQPRSALGLSFRGLAKLLGREDILAESAKLKNFNVGDFEKKGEEIAEKIKDFIPVVYSSARNGDLAFNWKIGFNETTKIPAFWNVFPELNHNEMTGFDVSENTKKLSEKFTFIFLEDEEDYPKTRKRMEVTRKLYEDRGLPVIILKMEGGTRMEKIFVSSITADWTAHSLGEMYGVDTEQVPMVEKFKALIRG